MIYSNERGSVIDSEIELTNILLKDLNSWYMNNQKFIEEEFHKQFANFVCFGEATFKRYSNLPKI